jgi:hypothetical protein
MSIQINKIKYDRKAKSVQIEYDQPVQGVNCVDDVKIILKSSDEPLPEFSECLAKLAPFVESICQLPVGYCEEAEIRGVSLSHSNGVMGAVITALVPLDTAYSPVCINTPHLPSDQYNEGGEAPELPSGCTKIINQLIIEAERYIGGERTPDNQTSLEI